VLRLGGLTSVSPFLVDTTVLIDLSKGVPGVRQQIDELIDSGAALAVCPVNVAEFCAGLASDRIPHWFRLLHTFEFWDITFDAAVRAGVFRYAQKRQGWMLKLPDALVAGVAATRGATILTDNSKDFMMLGLPVRTLRFDSPGDILPQR
jgi:predicted nucleic acid-binding protein